jgi:hypothetical protein
MEGTSQDKLFEGHGQGSILPTQPTEGAPLIAGSADRLADGENSLFDKGLIDTA